jgi:hypothetical protein
MRILGVELRFPTQTELLLVPFVVAGSTYLGSLIQKTTAGSAAPVAGMAAAGGVAAFLILAGADFDAGWRGFALTFGASLLAFVVTMVGFPLL